MNLTRVIGVAALALVPTLSFAQAADSAGGGAGVAAQTKIAVIDIERIAAESSAGKALMQELGAEQQRIEQETQQMQQELADMQTKLASDILSQDAKVRLQRDMERKRTDSQRRLEDLQAEFEAKRQDGEARFQAQLAPIVEAVAKEQGIGLIFRATPGLTFILDESLDISPLVVQKLDESQPAPGDGGDDDRPDAQ